MANPVTVTPALGHAPAWLQGIGSPGYDAVDLRRPASGFDRGEGVASYGAYRVTQRGAGANMSVDVNQDTLDGGAWVRGDSVNSQGLYYVPPDDATINVDVTAAHATLPRLDLVVLEVKDDAHDSSGLNTARVRIVDGTATAGATLDNRNGAAGLPVSCLHLADVLVAAADTSITNSEIRDRRPFVHGVIPPLLTDVDMVPMRPAVGVQRLLSGALSSSTDLAQGAVLCVLPRRIIAATRIRWKYKQGATALTGNYNIGIYDASGRAIVNTGSVAFTGAANSLQARSETITATNFDAGMYYVFMGIDTTNAGTVDASIVPVSVDFPDGGNCANSVLALGSGGVTAPTTLLGFVDIGASSTSGQFGCNVPIIALSVG